MYRSKQIGFAVLCGMAALNLTVSGCAKQAPTQEQATAATSGGAGASGTPTKTVAAQATPLKKVPADELPIQKITMHYQDIVLRINDYLKQQNQTETAVAFIADNSPYENKIETGRVQLHDANGDHWQYVLLTRVQGIWDVEKMRDDKPFTHADAPRGTHDEATGAEQVEGVVQKVATTQGDLLSLDVRVEKNDTPNGKLQTDETVQIEYSQRTGTSNPFYPKQGDQVVAYVSPSDPRIWGGELGWYGNLDSLFVKKDGHFYNVDHEAVSRAVTQHSIVDIANGADQLEFLQPLQADLKGRTYKHAEKQITLEKFTPLVTDPDRVTGLADMDVELGPNPNEYFQQSGKQSLIVTFEKTNGTWRVSDLEVPPTNWSKQQS